MHNSRHAHLDSNIWTRTFGLAQNAAGGVSEEMREHWQAFLDEAEDVLQRKKLLPFWRGIKGGALLLDGNIPENQRLGTNLLKVFTQPHRLPFGVRGDCRLGDSLLRSAVWREMAPVALKRSECLDSETNDALEGYQSINSRSATTESPAVFGTSVRIQHQNFKANHDPGQEIDFDGSTGGWPLLRRCTESFRSLRHLSLQYFTSSQTFAHFFRHLNGRWQTTQSFSGKLGFL